MALTGLLQLAFTLRYDQSPLHYVPPDEGRAECIHQAPLLEPYTICPIIDLTANSYYKVGKKTKTKHFAPEPKSISWMFFVTTCMTFGFVFTKQMTKDCS